jgi:hypothetical protein
LARGDPRIRGAANRTGAWSVDPAGGVNPDASAKSCQGARRAGYGNGYENPIPLIRRAVARMMGCRIAAAPPGGPMTQDTVETETHAYHGWPIRVVCEFQVTQGRFVARSYVTPGGQHERATPGAAAVELASADAKSRALKAARKYIDSILVD